MFHKARAIGALVAVAATTVAATPTVSPQAVTPLLSAVVDTSPDTAVSGETGALSFVRADAGAVLWRDDAGVAGSLDEVADSAVTRARSFLAAEGANLGLTGAERDVLGLQVTDVDALSAGASELRVGRVEVDDLGMQHVFFDQYFDGLEVVGADLVVHLNGSGVTAVNGTFVPDVAVTTTPAIVADVAGVPAVKAANAEYDRSDLSITVADLVVHRIGLVEGYVGDTVLAWRFEVASAGREIAEQVIVDATTGVVVGQWPLVAHAKERAVYTPEYNPNAPQAGRVRDDATPIELLGPIEDLYRWTGDVYDLFSNGFGRDSFDGEGAEMISVLLVNQACPNAYWNSTTTNYCPGFALDDVVAHEWGHAYTERTHGLIYGFQSGALNEAYSDIWGETVDLLNGEDGNGGADNDNNSDTGGQRWAMGEDLDPVQGAAFGADNGLRDMWNPRRLGYPEQIECPEYHCALSDKGGVHTNSGVANHTYAMLVDGKTFAPTLDDRERSDITVEGIGFNRAAAIYWRAQSVYQTPITQFREHADSLVAACNDLIGAELNDLVTGEVAAEVITSADCEQVVKATTATGMLTLDGDPCGFEPFFRHDVPEVCDEAEIAFSEDFESGLGAWTQGQNNVFVDHPGYEWETATEYPDPHEGQAAFARDYDQGSCNPLANDRSGQFWLESPDVAVPSSGTPLLRFDHLFSTESAFDGGNVMMSVNGGAFVALTPDNYVVHAPDRQFDALADQNTSPKAGEWAFQGGGLGQAISGWGTSLIDLSTVASGGDTIRFRLDFGQDGCGGALGWYVDNILVYACPD